MTARNDRGGLPRHRLLRSDMARRQRTAVLTQGVADPPFLESSESSLFQPFRGHMQPRCGLVKVP
ncbi:MAG TPA: hypothetical protein PKL21_11775, partial [Anaerolineaceae bacterium]|nr:hypothetical protein [Anaerolineaceae bacterium]